ncbi:Uncharacterized protein DAT39_009133 [Clarias magur]|uniref:Uncharacterized protein n=1 Tax=Clarias magur TaxID=1594786 RepID=A0A8J4TSV1_CLAMG|nr:Uncharacterized protein DAT39_009133 [Clarias magur]
MGKAQASEVTDAKMTDSKQQGMTACAPPQSREQDAASQGPTHPNGGAGNNASQVAYTPP